jgi:hypothetical protein
MSLYIQKNKQARHQHKSENTVFRFRGENGESRRTRHSCSTYLHPIDFLEDKIGNVFCFFKRIGTVS